MRIVIDTNEIFSFFNRKSKAREISLLPNIELYSPLFSLEEIKKHKSDILERFNLTEEQYSLIEKLLRIVVNFISEDEYSQFTTEARGFSPDPNDVDFFALALKLNCPIWSQDGLLKEQKRVKVYSTFDLMKELGLE